MLLMTTASERVARRQRVLAAALDHDGVLSRSMLLALGVRRSAVAAEVAGGRWRLAGRRTVLITGGPLTPTALRWRAVWEAGPRAVLDGVSALQAAGLSGFESDVVHVSVPHEGRSRSVDGVRIHRVRDLVDEDVLGQGLRRTRTEVATLRAASWAVSDRQAALIVCLAVQQRLVHPGRLRTASLEVLVRRRRALLRQVVLDVTDGAESLGELDFARLCRRRGIPEPSRQVMRRGPRGRIYLDVRWDGIALVVEIDGAQHRQGLAVSNDNLRRNALALEGEVVLAIDLVGLRLLPEAFLDRVESAHQALSAWRAA